MDYENITIAILAKDKSHCLPTYLRCILNQEYPKDKLSIYIKSNNNNDNTTEILSEWANTNRHLYKDFFEDYSDVDENIQQYKPHEWNSVRFKILGKIRQDSMQWALEHDTHYFVVDCDNFIFPHTLKNLMQSKVPIVGPLLRTSNTCYSNYHEKCNEFGYLNTDKSEPYYFYLNQKVKQVVGVDVIHCCYLVRKEYIQNLHYDDGSNRHEYVIFSDSARKNGILQFLDTRYLYGYITFEDTLEGLKSEPWFRKFLNLSVNENGILIISPQAEFGNRMRAFSSGIAIGLRDGKDIYYMWENCHKHLSKGMVHFSHYFDEIIPSTSAEEHPNIDEILTEWVHGDGWYNLQSGAQKQWPNCKNIIKMGYFFNGTQKKTLMETSLPLDVDDDKIIEIYRDYFKPKQKYMDYINNFENVDVGISIRRGDFLKYFPECECSMERAIEWMKETFALGTKICLFSCDHEFRECLKEKLKDCFTFVNNTFDGAEWEISFIEFLILSYKCDAIYGTPKFSFCEQAGLFGGKKNYSPIPIKK